jgi:hypothetical protein
MTKGAGFLGQISPLIGRIFLEDTFDIDEEGREILSREDAIENDVSL